MEIKEHLYFCSQKVTISGVLNYIIRSNSLYTYITSNSFNKPNTGDPLKKKKKKKKKKMAGALEEKAGETERDKMAGALEEKAGETERNKMAGALEEKEEKGEDKGEKHNSHKGETREKHNSHMEAFRKADPKTSKESKRRQQNNEHPSSPNFIHQLGKAEIIKKVRGTEATKPLFIGEASKGTPNR